MRQAIVILVHLVQLLDRSWCTFPAILLLCCCSSTAVGMSGHRDFQPKQISTIQCNTGSSTATKSPQVAVIPPLVDLTKVPLDSDSGKKDDKSKGSSIR